MAASVLPPLLFREIGEFGAQFGAAA